MPFACSICEEESTRICVECTKDTCGNHLCDRCMCCSDCCQCDLKLDSDTRETAAREWKTPMVRDPEPAPHPYPMPDPDPAPEPDPMPIPAWPGEQKG